MNKHRISSIDILKIICIFMILILHYMNNHIGNGMVKTTDIIGLSTRLIEVFCIISVNVFVMITGYCSTKKEEINIRKILNLIVITVFWAIIIYIFYLLFFDIDLTLLNLKQFTKTILSRWFIINYILLCLLIPFLNILMKHLDKRTSSQLIIIILVINSIWPTFLTNIVISDKGYSIINMICIYLIGNYLKKYDVINTCNLKKCFIIEIITIVVTFIFSFYSNRAFNYNSIFVILQSVCFFILFMKNQIYFANGKILSRISGCSLAIYLIHENEFIAKWLYQDIFKTVLYIGKWKYIFNLIYTCCGIFIICMLLELVRQYLFSKTFDRIINNSKILNKKIKIRENV